jgi:hypothetical protein
MATLKPTNDFVAKLIEVEINIQNQKNIGKRKIFCNLYSFSIVIYEGQPLITKMNLALFTFE